MPVEGISSVRRLPRLGIVRLGEKAETAGGKEYPKKLDHFNLKDAPGVAEVFGAKPKVLEIMLPHEDPEVFFPQWRKAYGKSSGLFCKGDGKIASRVRFGVSDGKPRFEGDKDFKPAGYAFDPDGEKFIKSQGLKVEVGARFDLPCLGAECPLTKAKTCKPLGQLMFLLPKVPGVGIFQISTGSFNSLVDVNSYVEIVRGIAGRVSMIPLTLSLVPKKVTVNGKSTGIFHLKLEYKGKMADLAKYRDVKYLSADILPQIEHETPADLVPHGGEDLDRALSGQDKIAGPSEDEAVETGKAAFTLGAKFLVKRGETIELKSQDGAYRVSEEVAKFLKGKFSEGDSIEVSWVVKDGARWVEGASKAAAESAF